MSTTSKSKWQEFFQAAHAGGATLIAPILLIAFLSIVMGFTAPPVSSLPSAGQWLYKATQWFGIVAIIYWVAVHVLSSLQLNQTLPYIAVALVFRAVVLTFALVEERVHGAELATAIAYAQSHLDLTLAVCAGAVLVGAIFHASPSTGSLQVRALQTAGHVSAANHRRRLSEKDQFGSAVHEAGHLLIYAGLQELPSDLTVSIKTEIGAFESDGGSVGFSYDQTHAQTEHLLRWIMLRNLAGGEAERLVFGDRSTGSSADMRSWIDTATRFLLSGFGEPYFADPTGEAQLAHNRSVMADLKSGCEREVQIYLGANHDLLVELARAIADSKSMTVSQIAPYLSRVKNASNLPQVPPGIWWNISNEAASGEAA